MGKIVVDNRRWLWLTYTNVNDYFTGVRYFVITHGFAYSRLCREDEPCVCCRTGRPLRSRTTRG